MKRVKAIEEIKDCRQPLVRLTGKRIRAVLPISLDHDLRLETIHKIALKIERKVKNLAPNANTEPTQSNLENAWKLVTNIAEVVRGTRGVTNIHLRKVNVNILVDKVVAEETEPSKARVAEMMSTSPVTVDADVILIEAVKMMAEHRIRKVPDVRNGILCEILTARDLAKHFPE